MLSFLSDTRMTQADYLSLSVGTLRHAAGILTGKLDVAPDHTK